MSDNKVRVHFAGREETAGAVYLDDLSALTKCLASCLHETERAITDEKPHVRYRIDRLESGSIDLDFAGDTATGSFGISELTVSLFNQTVCDIDQRKPIDSRLGAPAIESYRRLADMCLHRSGETLVSQVPINTRFLANIDELLSGTISSEGSIKGRIERLNLHNKNEFALYPPTTDRGINCTFDNSLFALVHQAVKQNCTVFGTMQYHGDDPYPTRVTVQDIKIHPSDDELPTLESLRGLLPASATDGLSAVDFVRGIRNE